MRRADEVVRVVAADRLHAVALFVWKAMLGLEVRDAQRLVAINRDNVIGDQVLRRLEPADGATRCLGPLVAADLAWSATSEHRGKIYLDFLGEAGTEQLPIAHVDAGSVTQLHIANFGTIEQQLNAGIVHDGTSRAGYTSGSETCRVESSATGKLPHGASSEEGMTGR